MSWVRQRNTRGTNKPSFLVGKGAQSQVGKTAPLKKRKKDKGSRNERQTETCRDGLVSRVSREIE